MFNRPYFAGLFSCENSQNYTQNGVLIHKPPFGDAFWGRTAHVLSVEFTDAETGEITDRFYGSCNDFDWWFAAKAARGDKFDVIVHEYNKGRDGSVHYDEIGVKMGYIGTKFGTIAQGRDGAWKVVEIEPLREACGMYFLYNSKLSLALRSSGREKEEAELISAALAAGASCF